MLRLSAVQAREDARRAAAHLATAGVQRGQRIVIDPPREATIGDAQQQQRATMGVVWGALASGIIPVPVNPDLTAHERDAIVRDADAALVLDSTRALMAAIEHPAQAELADYPLGRPMHYTSGTTGRPKGVWAGVLDDARARELWQYEIDLWQQSPDDLSLVHGPLSHSGPLRFALYTLLAGGDVLLPGWFDVDATVRALDEHRPTTAFTVPAHLQRLLTRPLPASPYRMLVHAGSACPPSVKQGVHDWAGAANVWEFYGSTEGQFTVMPGTDWAEHPTSVGQSRSDRELRIIDGQVWCAPPPSGHFVYWNDEEKTRASWRKLDGQAWFTVGDLGRLDGGWLHLDGRREDLIISGGMNVYPAEVEGALCSYPGVIDAAVFGRPDDVWGQRVCAAVMGDVEPQAVESWVRERLAGYKRPKELHIVTDLPRTASGKIQRLRVAAALGLGDDPTME